MISLGGVVFTQNFDTQNLVSLQHPCFYSVVEQPNTPAERKLAEHPKVQAKMQEYLSENMTYQ